MAFSIDDLALRPIPDQSLPLGRKKGYREIPADLSSSYHHEPLVDVSTYGIAGQSYYSRPNAALDVGAAQVSPVVYVRKGTAEKLAAINDSLRSSEEAARIFGGSVELYIEEGLRSQRIQRLLYEDLFPGLIRTQLPHLSEQEVLSRRDSLIAAPSDTETSPSPHATGAAIDVSLRYQRATKSFVLGSEVFMGHDDADMGDTTTPDFFERTRSSTAKHALAQRNRRLFYWIMKGSLTGEDSGFCVNPTEWWHWSYGDQLWAAVTGAPAALYGLAKESAAEQKSTGRTV
jgi:D-alanyl-D-alanine dipeptidase